MKVRDVMSRQVVRIGAEEPAEVAARTLTHYNLGALPVCGNDGRVCGMVTDRDLVIRCMAQGRNAGNVKVREVMTGRVITAEPEMTLDAAAELMGQEQIRRLPVVENGRLCGMIGLADLATQEKRTEEAAKTLAKITQNLSQK